MIYINYGIKYYTLYNFKMMLIWTLGELYQNYLWFHFQYWRLFNNDKLEIYKITHTNYGVDTDTYSALNSIILREFNINFSELYKK